MGANPGREEERTLPDSGTGIPKPPPPTPPQSHARLFRTGSPLSKPRGTAALVSGVGLGSQAAVRRPLLSGQVRCGGAGRTESAWESGRARLGPWSRRSPLSRGAAKCVRTPGTVTAVAQRSLLALPALSLKGTLTESLEPKSSFCPPCPLPPKWGSGFICKCLDDTGSFPGVVPPSEPWCHVLWRVVTFIFAVKRLSDTSPPVEVAATLDLSFTHPEASLSYNSTSQTLSETRLGQGSRPPSVVF